MRQRSAILEHVGNHVFEARTGAGRLLRYGDDAPSGEHSPVELMVASLAACSAMDVIGILEKKRQVVERYTIEASAEQRDEYPQVLTRVDVVHVVEGSVVLEAAVRRAIELSATKYCPVNAMLSAGETEIHHGYRMHCSGAPEAGVEPRDAEGEVVVTGPYRRPEIVPG